MVKKWNGRLTRMKQISRCDFQPGFAAILTVSKKRLTSLFLPSIIQCCLILSIFVQPLLCYRLVVSNGVYRRVVAVIGLRLIEGALRVR